MAHLVLVPVGFLIPRPRCLVPVHEHLWTVTSTENGVRCRGHNDEQDTTLFLSFSKVWKVSGSMTKRYLSLIVGVKKNFGWPFLI